MTSGLKVPLAFPAIVAMTQNCEPNKPFLLLGFLFVVFYHSHRNETSMEVMLARSLVLMPALTQESSPVLDSSDASCDTRVPSNTVLGVNSVEGGVES